MTMIAILPISGEEAPAFYQAVAGDRQSQGKTPGEALDALSELLLEEESGTLVIVQNLRPDRFFTTAQRE